MNLFDFFKRKKVDPADPVNQVNFRADGWINPTTGLGIPTVDKSVTSYFVRGNRLSDQELSDLYHFDDLCIKIVRLRPEEMFRVGYNISVRKPNEVPASTKKPQTKDDDDPTPPKESEDQGPLLEQKARSLELDTKLLEAMCLGRAYGGSILFIGANDGRPPDQPLDDTKSGEITFLTVFDRRELIVHEWYSDPLAPNYGSPKSYMLYPQFFLDQNGKSIKTGIIVHESRCIRFEGTHADRRERIRLWGWTYSVLQPVYDVVRDFENLYRAMGYMVQDANQSVFKLSGLIDQVAKNSTELRNRMQFVEETRSVNRAVLLDVDEGEDFIKVPTTFSGVPDISDRFQQRLSAATGIPVTLQMGRSPAGLNATGDADLTSFYNSVARDQENELKPRLLRVYKMLAKSMSIDPEAVVVQCRPLVEMTESERADLELKHAQKDKLYVDSGVLTPEEVALSRFSDPEEFGLRIQLDQASLEARHESQELALENPDFSQTNAAMGLGPDGKPPPAPPGGSLQPGAKGAGQSSGQRVSQGSTGTSGPPRANTKT